MSQHLLSFLKDFCCINSIPKIMVQFCQSRLYLGIETVIMVFRATRYEFFDFYFVTLQVTFCMCMSKMLDTK